MEERVAANVAPLSPHPRGVGLSSDRHGDALQRHPGVHQRRLGFPGATICTTHLSLMGRLRRTCSAPLADDPLPLANKQGGLAAAVFDRHLEARAALVVDLDEVHHAPARPLFGH
jgi:hypothetical protein